MKDIQTLGWREAIKEISEKLVSYPNNLQNIHTPFDLCSCIIGKLKEYSELEGKDILTLNLEFVESLIYDFGVAKERIWFLTDCKEKAAICSSSRYKGVNVMNEDFLETLGKKEGRKWDVCVMNPPYQAPQTKRKQDGGDYHGGGSTLWDKFVFKALNLVKNNGYLCAIHPSKWRKPDNKLWQTMREKQIDYLEIHDFNDGVSTFGCQTRYDWYVLKNCACHKETIVKDQEGVMSKIDIRDVPFIPNAMIDRISRLIAKPNEKRCHIIHDYSTYDHRKLQKEQSKQFPFPCVYAVNKNSEPTFHYASYKDNSHFGISKVIFPSGHFGSVGVWIDAKGEYGLTEYAKGIVDSPKNLPDIARALMSPEFKKIAMAISTATTELDKSALRMFRHDFWKEFI